MAFFSLPAAVLQGFAPGQLLMARAVSPPGCQPWDVSNASPLQHEPGLCPRSAQGDSDLGQLRAGKNVGKWKSFWKERIKVNSTVLEALPAQRVARRIRVVLYNARAALVQHTESIGTRGKLSCCKQRLFVNILTLLRDHLRAA